MNHKMDFGKLLDNYGNLVDSGFAFDLVREYRRSEIKAGKGRIKEWDYYYIGNDEYGIALTVADNSYMAMASISFIDLKNKKEITKSKIKWFTYGKLCLPRSSKIGDVVYENKNYSMEFLKQEDKRKLICAMKKFRGNDDFYCVIDLTETTNGTMVIATPFEKDKHFYYNQKINCQKASGYFSIGNDKYEFNPENSRAVLDWGRGVWTYKNTWYWASASGITSDKKEIGFNLGYGFGDTSRASENMFFYNKRAYKLNDVKFEIPVGEDGKDIFMGVWKMTSEDKQIDLTFMPILNRHADTNALIIRSNQNQVFGIYNGYIMFGDDKIEINNLTGFAEKVYNKW